MIWLIETSLVLIATKKEKEEKVRRVTIINIQQIDDYLYHYYTTLECDN